MNKNEPKHYDSVSKWQEFLQKFSTKKITKVFAESVKVKRQNLANSPKPQKQTRLKIKVVDVDLALDAKFAARNSNGRIQNWTSAKPSIHSFSKGDYLTNNEGRYSRHCSYTKYSYTPLYTSYVEVSNCGKGLVYRRGFKGKIKSRVIYAPSGMKFQKDDLGLVLKRLSDGMDYHPTAKDLQSKQFATVVRAEMAKNYKARLVQKKAEKQSKILEKLFQRDLRTTMVTLHDSRKAGNCVEGSLQFAERRLGISRQEIIKGGHLFKVPAYKLVKTGEARALAAAKAAWNRETTICI